MGARRIVVTGCTGLLGANVCLSLRDRWDVVGTSRNCFSMPDVHWAQVDCCDIEAMAPLLDGAYAVVHCAAMTNVDACEADPEKATRVNRDCAVALARRASDVGARFVFISTDAVFSGNLAGSRSEEDPVDPINVYGKTKVLAEQDILGIPGALIIRMNMYGFNYLEKKSLAEWVADSLEKGEGIGMFDDVVFSAMPADSIASWIEDSLNKGLEGLYHLACSDSMSKFDFGCALAQALELPELIRRTSVDDFSFIAKRSKNMALDPSRIERDLGRQAPTMAEGIALFAEQRRSGYVNRLRGLQ